MKKFELLRNRHMKPVLGLMALFYFFIGTISPVVAISKKPGTSLFENGWSQRQEIETRTPPTLDPTACEATEGISATGQSLVGDPNCVGLAYPDVKDEAKLEKGINDYIQKIKPNSPFAGKANVFIEAGKKWGINPMFMVNIGRMETQLATDGGSGIKKGTFNPFGIGCRVGPTDGGAGEGNCIGRQQVFNSFESSVFGLGQVLREVYLDKGLRTAETVFPVYAPPFENDTDEYVKQVNGWMQEISSLVGDGIECNGSAGSPIATTPSAPAATNSTNQAPSVVSSVSQGGAQTVVVLDPGHSGQKISSVDEQSGLKDIDYPNPIEIDQVWDTTQKVKAKLEQAGYKVILTKNNVKDSVSLRQRANIADAANAAISVSIHNDQQFEFNSWGEVYVQKVGLFRGDSPRVEFKDANVAEKSQRYGNIMVEARKKAENNPNIVVKDNTFDNRGEIEPGNIPLILLFSKVPWVYNEAGGEGYDSEKYAEGIFNGIKNSVPPGSQQSSEELSCEKSGASISGSKQSVVDTANSAFDRNKGITEYEGEILQFTDGAREPWCADFVSWVYKNAGLPFSGGSSGGWRIAGVLSMQAFFKNTPGYEYFEVGQKQPEPGDVAFYIGSQTPDGGSTQHVNVVTAVSGSTMTTVGGNEGNQVKKSERAIQLGENSLVGFGRKLN